MQAALLGSKTRFVGRVGSSSDGSDIAQNFARLGVDVSLISKSDDCACGIALIEVQEDTGDNRIVVVPGSNGLCVGTDVLPALAGASYLLLQLEIPFQAVAFALHEAAKLKVQ